MKTKDQLLLEQAYRKIYENESLLIPRRSKEEREKNYKIALNKKIQEYIKNGSKGDLDLAETPITSLPEGLTVGGSLVLSDTPITSLPKGLKVGGDLDLSDTPITSLPEGLKVGGDLDLSYTPITSLPEGLKVGGYLDLSGTPITSLPEGLKVVGDLFLYGTPLAKQYTEEQIKQMCPGIRGGIYD